jgi:hypothetical protein
MKTSRLFLVLAFVFFCAAFARAPDANAQVISAIPWNPADQKLGGMGGDDVAGEYILPFTFPFFGRSIVKISVNRASRSGRVVLLVR